ncbi:M23 family metallopeptidase [Lacibacterium aquatile]|uniref:M23 family metallopeptidase n=1 Tax=Lacibacterium aquatile TaxID=1168082 RepID=A0ABW5DME1_9PROT
MLKTIMAGVLLATPALALDLDRVPEQGMLIRGKVSPGTKVTLDGGPLTVSPAGDFVFGIGRDAKGSVTLKAGAETKRYEIKTRSFKIDRVDGLPQDKVTPDPSVTERITAEAAKIRAAREKESAQTGFAQAWQWPAPGRISGVYGSQRVLNGEPRTPHYGTDVAAPTGTPALSPVDGTIVLAEADLFFTGGTVMIDHGQGVQSVFAHLSTVDVQVGDVVKRGQSVGKIGMTGRATGPHLHWGVYWRRTPVDPAGLVPAEPPKLK